MSNHILKLENNMNTIYNLISTIQRDLNHVVEVTNKNKLTSLLQENAILEKKIQEAKQKYLKLVGNSSLLSSVVKFDSTFKNETNIEEDTPQETVKTEKPKKAKAVKAPSANAKQSDERPVDISRLDLRIGKILEAFDHPAADSLYVEIVDVGEPAPRKVVSGLVKHVPIHQMQNRMVVLLCNLKPATMRGVTSQAMVMCASTAEKVEILSPPNGAQPGDLVFVDGYARNPDSVLNPKKKIFETVAPDLKTNDKNQATYKGICWTVKDKGFITSQSLSNAKIK